MCRNPFFGPSPKALPYTAIIAVFSLLALACLSPRINLLDRLIAVPDQRRPADVIVAFSASQLNRCEGHPNIFQREYYAALLLRQHFSLSGKLLISGVYTRQPGALEACRVKLANQFNIAPDQLLIDNSAETTLDNARNVRKIMSRNHWRTALLVTSRSHMFRADHALQKQGVSVYTAQIQDYPAYHNAWLDTERINNLQRLLYEYGALLKYKWYGYI